MTDKNKISFTKLVIEKEIPDERIEQLKQILPEAIEDNQINCEKAKEILGDFVVDPDQQEHFGLNWPGKRQSIRIARTPSKQTLVPVQGDGVDEDKTQNIFIEGENLEVLKLLQKSYTGKIKMIYIDPPYNTGNDFIYKDKFSETEKSYLESTGQVDEEGNDMVANKKSSGRFHSNWLNMIYPRLKLAKELLTDDGVIFVSIDDNEVHNLREIMNEIFGEENFVSNIIWQARTSISDDKEISANHNHTIIYSRERGKLKFFGIPLNKEEYSNPDNDSRGPWKLVPLDANKPGGDTKYPIINPKNGVSYFPPKGRIWAINSIECKKLLIENRIKFGLNDDSAPKRKLFYNERIAKGDTKTPSSLMMDAGTTKDGTTEVETIFGMKNIFDYPKPTTFIKRIISFGSSSIKDEIVLDFFAGSGTTAHAVMGLNSENNGNRRFICVQMPEITSDVSEARKAGFDSIAQICKERIRRAGKKIKEETKADIDYGFKVFKLQKESNIKDDSESFGLTPQMTLPVPDENSNSLRKGWTKDGLLTEIILLEGFPLTSKIEKDPNITTNEVFVVTSSFEDRKDKLLICLDPELKRETVDSLSVGELDNFIFLESALPKEGGDEIKQILHERFKTRIKVI